MTTMLTQLRAIDTGMMQADEKTGGARDVRTGAQIDRRTLVYLKLNGLVEYDPLLTGFLRLTDKGRATVGSFA